MIKRNIQKKIEKNLKQFPVTAILGSRQVGKTTLAKQIREGLKDESVYLDLELHTDMAKLNEAELYLKQYSDRLVIIDEIQRKPELFALLRALVDQNRIPGRFLILGSASPDLIRKTSETLAGRIAFQILSPFSIQEVGTVEENINHLWFNGGYPECYLSKDLNFSFEWRQNFIKTYLERDIPQFGFSIPATQMNRFWMILAHSHGQLWNASKTAASLGMGAQSSKRYLDILCDTFIVRQLQPFFTNIKKRLVKSPKVYFRDTGLLHAILNVRDMDELFGHPVVGASWEGFVIEQILRMLPNHIQPYFYRTGAGSEIDLLLVKANNFIPIEIKFSLTPKPTKGFYIAMDDLNCEKGYIVYLGDEMYPISDKIMTLPLAKINEVVK